MNAGPLPLKKELKIKSDKNNEYNIEIFVDSNSFLNIIIKTIDKIPSRKYDGKYSLDEMKKKNKYFLISENISQAFNLLEPNLKNNSLIEKMNELIFSINIPNPLSPQIDFIVNVEKKDYNSSINELSEIINIQNNKINSLEQTIKDEKKEYNSSINKLCEIINKLNDKINSLEEMNKNLEKKLLKKYLWELR
jgi:exonuclease VII small subunit